MRKSQLQIRNVREFFIGGGIGAGITALFLFAGIASAALTFSGTAISGDGAISMDGASTISIGSGTATGVTIGKTGQTVAFPGSIGGTSLKVISSTSLSGAEGTYVSGKYAYVTHPDGGGYAIFDVSNPANPVAISTSDGSGLGSLHTVFVAGPYAFLGQRNGANYEIDNISNPAAPTTVFEGSLNSCMINSSNSSTGSGKYMYVSGGNGLCVLDVSNPAAPVQVGHLSDSTHIPSNASIRIVGHYAYIVGGAGPMLTIVDISNPASPTVVGSVTVGSASSALADVTVSGKYAYVLGPNALEVVDVSNPTSPSVVSTLTDTVNFTDAGSRFFVASAGRYVYTAAGGYVAVVDVSNPASPVVVNSSHYSSSNCFRGMALSGRYMYVGNYCNTTWDIIDTGGVDTPSASIGSIETSLLNVSSNTDIGGSLNVHSGLNVGNGGIFSNGPLSVSLSSATQTNPVSGYFQGRVGIGTTGPAGMLDIAGAISSAVSATIGNYLSLTGSTLTDNGTAASGTAPGATFNSIGQGTLVAANTGVTTTNAYGLYLAGAPVKSTNESVVSTTALDIAAGAVGTATNSYGLQVNAQTGATNNYAAAFLGGNVGVGTATPGAKLDVNSSSIIIESSATPSSSSATCTTGTISWDASYVYVCVATNTWKRSAISTW